MRILSQKGSIEPAHGLKRRAGGRRERFDMLADVTAPIVLTFQLLRRFWPQLVALVLLGILFDGIFRQLAVNAAFFDHYAGLAVLTLVALTQLVVVVAMFQVLRPALPEIAAAQAEAEGSEKSQAKGGASRFASMVTIALLPFFAYYAASGFLGDIVRQYSRTALEQAPFGESFMPLDVLDSWWILLPVAVAWAVRKFALRMQKDAAHPFWQIVVVVCETNWIFTGLYVLSRWKDRGMELLMESKLWAFFQTLVEAIAGPITRARAQGMVPVEDVSLGAFAELSTLFWYMLLPVVWLVMTALIYGYDVNDDKELMHIHNRMQRFGERYRAIPAFFRDFIEHFIGGYRSRYLPIANGVRITLSSGVVLLVTLIVGYRLIDWGASWLWLGTAHLIGHQPGYAWDVIPDGISLFFGSQFQDSSMGILVEPLRICFLAAVLETAFALPKRARSSQAPQAAE